MVINLLESKSAQLMNIVELDPNYVTGFTDAEGCFHVVISRRSSSKWRVTPIFEINLDSHDVQILYSIQKFFRVSTFNDLKEVIVPHFINYPLQSLKFSDFKLWAEVIKLMDKKAHLNEIGF